jgi:O-antigen/teichoic acid export membrane protein
VTGGIRGLAKQSLIFSVSTVVIRGISFVLLPLYTRFLGPADYAIVAVALSLAAILTIVLPLGLHHAVPRTYFGTDDPAARNEALAALWLGVIVAAGVGALLLEVTSPWAAGRLFRDIPYSPYLRLTVWNGFFMCVSLVPLGFWQSGGQATRHALFLLVAVLLNNTFAIGFLLLGWGAQGYLAGLCASNAVLAVAAAFIMRRRSSWRWRPDILRRALLFGIPLIPHGIAAWVIELADRSVLKRFVPLADLGLYSIAYQFGMLVVVLGTAANLALVPYMQANLTGPRPNVAEARLAVTYFVTVIAWAGLALGLAMPHLLPLMTAPAYHGAVRLAIWITVAQTLSVLYFVPANLLFVHGRTAALPVVTVLSGFGALALLVLLAPSHGIWAGVWSTLAAYTMLLVLAWAAACRLSPFPYDYRRLLTSIGVAAILWGIATLLPGDLTLSLPTRALLLLVYPVLLAALGFFQPREVEFLRQICRSALRRFWGPRRDRLP